MSVIRLNKLQWQILEHMLASIGTPAFDYWDGHLLRLTALRRAHEGRA